MVRYEAGGGVASILLDRPPLNVLDIPTSMTLASALRRAGRDRSVRVVVIAGKGKCFSAGVDVADHTRARVGAMLKAFHGAVKALLALEKPVVAAVHGHCLGGGMELALACDFIVAKPGSTFALPEIKLACYPPVAAALLPRLVGHQRAAEMILLGESLTVRRMRALGLLSPYRLDVLLAKLLSLSGAALGCAKTALRSGSLNASEQIYLRRLTRTRDMEEGVRAFLEKKSVLLHQ